MHKGHFQFIMALNYALFWSRLSQCIAPSTTLTAAYLVKRLQRFGANTELVQTWVDATRALLRFEYLEDKPTLAAQLLGGLLEVGRGEDDDSQHAYAVSRIMTLNPGLVARFWQCYPQALAPGSFASVFVLFAFAKGAFLDCDIKAAVIILNHTASVAWQYRGALVPKSFDPLLRTTPNKAVLEAIVPLLKTDIQLLLQYHGEEEPIIVEARARLAEFEVLALA
jgi:hypothetical protein